MSALQVPPTPSTRRPHLRLVETPPAPRRSLAPTGPLQAWRRRIGAVLVLIAALLLVVEALTGPVGPVRQVVPASSTTAVVEPGQTLWEVANEHAPAGVSTDAYVRELAELNGISNGSVDAWQVLRLPAG